MAAFHVFVEGATDDTPAGLTRLADAIANHYGLNAADLLPRLQRGRFRVKGNADRETADTYKRDLELLGARCTVEEASAENSGRATPLPFPAQRPATPPAGTPAVPASGLAAAGAAPSTTKPPPMTGLAAAGAAPSTTKPPPVSSLAAAVTPTGTTTPPPMGAASGAAGFQSGLSAAFSGEQPAADLGALSGEGLSLSLSSVDGVEDTRGAGGSFGPPGNGGVPASIGPAPEKPAGKDAKAAKPKDEPLDMFAPPEMQGEEFKVELSAEDKEFEARKRASTPPPVNDPTPAAGAAPGRKSQPSLQPPNAPARRTNPSMQVPNEPVTTLAAPPSKLGPLANERVRFAAGVVLAVLIGFVPAHFIARSKEHSADQEIDGKVTLAQNAADTPETYANLDRMRTDQLGRKEDEHRNAAIMGFAIWALVGGAIAFGWFKKIPWDELT